MKRSKRLILLSHCILNGNSKVSGLSDYPGAMESVVIEQVKKGTGIIQLPCPELTYIGLKRWGMTREQYDTAVYRNHCQNILMPFIFQIQDYLKNGYVIEQIIGIDGSPSCGVNITCVGFSGGEIDETIAHHNDLKEIPGRGIFMETLAELLSERDIVVSFSAIKEK